jgi:hypothetical protein
MIRGSDQRLSLLVVVAAELLGLVEKLVVQAFEVDTLEVADVVRQPCMGNIE